MAWAAVTAIISALSAIASATADGGSVEKDTSAQPGGLPQTPGTGPLNTPAVGEDPLLGVLGALSQMPDLSNVATNAQGPAAATNQASQVAVTDPGLNAPAAPETSGVEDAAKDIKSGDDIQNILAAIPAAIAAAGDLLGTGGQQGRTQRPAPVAGGRGGGLVGQFAQQPGGQQLNIGQLLAQLPGIR